MGNTAATPTEIDNAIPYPATVEADFITVLAWQFNGGLTAGH
jgi:hypothetical protein